MSPETRTSAFAARTWSSFRSPIAAEMWGNPTENVPAEAAALLALAELDQAQARDRAERSATASLLPVPRVWQERWSATAASKRPGQDRRRGR
jgi:hypothetical protein